MRQLRSGTAVFRTDPTGRILEWNAAAERLTGIDAAEAEDRRCWEVISGRAPDDAIVCHPGCAAARLAGEGRPVQCYVLDMPTRDGCKRLALSTIVLRGDDDSVILHTIQEAVLLARPGGDSVPALTRRQREILALLSEGVRAREIAMRLMLSETTVRNHIQSLLLTLGVHSQLEAVARAHALSLADERATG